MISPILAFGANSGWDRSKGSVYKRLAASLIDYLEPKRGQILDHLAFSGWEPFT